MTSHELVRNFTHNTCSGQLSGGQAEKLEQILADYLERLERGDRPDTKEIVAEHPELANELRDNLAKLAALHCAAIGMADGGESLDQLWLSHFGEVQTLGDFRLVRPIGRGGMGLVYEAEQISLARRVALKTLPVAAVLDPKQLARFKNEAQAAASLDHPHIVSVYAVGSDRGVHYYAMQYIEGLSLAQVVDELKVESRGLSVQSRNNSPPSEERLGEASPQETRCFSSLSTERSQRPVDYLRSVARLGIQAAKALHYAHEMGLVHRDVKPSNLLLDSDGELYVTDFGLAMTQGSSNLTVTGELLGTMRYMSPEQASGRRALVDRRTDIYSLGASLYELATLGPAFPEEDRTKLLQQIATDPPKLPSQINRHVAQDLETIILKALAKEPADRYETANELADDLERFVKLEPIRARRITRLQHVRSWCRRNKSVAGLLAAIAALLLVLSIGGPVAAIKQSRLTRKAQLELNAKNINQLYQDWYSGNVERVGAELKRHYETADKGEFLFEWELLRRLYEDSRKSILFEKQDHQTNFPAFVEFSPNGRWIACGQPGDRVAIYDVNQKTLRQLDNEPSGGAADVVFSPDCKELITVSWTGVVNRRDLSTSSIIGPIINCGVDNERQDRVKFFNSIRVSPDGTTVVVAMETQDTGSLVLVRLDEGEYTKIPAHDGFILAFDVSPDGSRLVSSGEDGLIKLWDLRNNEVIQTLNSRSSTLDVRFTSDGQRLIVCDYLFGVRVFDAVSLAELPGLRSEQQHVIQLAMHGDEILATVGEDDRILLWDMDTRNRIATLVGHEGNVRDMAFSPDGALVVSGAADDTLRLWSVGKVFRETKDRAASSRFWRTDLQFTADGQKLISYARLRGPLAGSVGAVMNEWHAATGECETFESPDTHRRCDLAIIPGTEHLLCGGAGRVCPQKQAIGRTHPAPGWKSAARVSACCRFVRQKMGLRLWTYPGHISPNGIPGHQAQGARLLRDGWQS